MPRYNKSNTKELKEFLHNSCVHDAKFLNIGILLTIKGDWPGNRETIISLTSEEDFSCMQKYFLKSENHMEDYIYLLFQMFSGDEVHILSKEVIIEVVL